MTFNGRRFSGSFSALVPDCKACLAASFEGRDPHQLMRRGQDLIRNETIFSPPPSVFVDLSHFNQRPGLKKKVVFAV